MTYQLRAMTLSLNYLLMTLKATKQLSIKATELFCNIRLTRCENGLLNGSYRSLEKCIYLQLGYTDETITFKFSSHVLKFCNIARDLGINVQSNLKLGLHCTEIARNSIAHSKLILKSFLSYNLTNLTHAYIAYVRPMLEYCSPVWSPYYI